MYMTRSGYTFVSQHLNKRFKFSRVMDHLKQKVKDHELDKREGEELKRLAIQHEIEKKKLEQIRMEEKIQLGIVLGNISTKPIT